MDPKNVKKSYSIGDLTVVWQSGRCIHSGQCVKNLPGVFRPRQSPWIYLEGGTKEDIIRTVQGCPSGALSLETGQPDGHS